jgi:photosystem II stability/assembly factor-like uncharacterized protein
MGMKTTLNAWTGIAILLFTFNSSAQLLEWRQMNSLISTYAELPGSPSVLLAGDEAGLIRRSTDKGVTWNMTSMVCESRINHIAFSTSKIGYAACNEPGLGLKTTDGGITWQRILFTDSLKPLVPYTYPLKRVVVLDSNIIFFDVFVHSGFGNAKPEVIVTRDGGKTFKLEYAPGNIYHLSGDTLLAFGRLSNGYKLQVSKSIDKGKTWVLIKDAPPGLASGIGFDGIDDAIIFNSHNFILTPEKKVSGDGNVYVTTDGGLSFTTLNLPSLGGKPEWVYFKDPMNGILLGGTYKTGYYTSNGGTSWTQMSINAGNTGQLMGKPLSDGSVISQSYGRSMITSDFGHTWTAQSDLFLVPGWNGPNDFLKVVNDDVAYAICANANSNPQNGLLKTSNKGISWKKVMNGSGIQFSSICPTGVDTFFFGGYESGTLNMQIRYTTNNGLAYSVKYTGTYLEPLSEIISIDKMHLVAYNVGAPLAAYISADGGMTWTKKTMVTALTRIVCPSFNTWYGYASNKVYKSIDQGVTWTIINGTINCMSDMEFYDDMNGYASGCNFQGFYKTTDGGQTWTNVLPNFAADVQYTVPTSMKFRTKKDFYYVDAAQNIKAVVRTNDGGASFKYFPGVQSQVKGAMLHFRDSLTGGLVGTAGQYVKYFGKQIFITDTIRYATVVGIAEISNSHAGFSLYPNPAHETLTVELQNNDNVKSVKVLDVTGRIIFSGKPQPLNHKMEIHIGALQPGIYLVQLETADRTSALRVVIQ